MTTSTAPLGRLAYSPTEVGRLLGCTRQHVQNLIARGELRSVKLGSKRLIPAAALDELLGNGEADDVTSVDRLDG